MSKLIVSIEEGQLRGKKSKDLFGEDFLSFLGIPYAESPIGDLRFKGPVPKKPWSGVRKAVKLGPACPFKNPFTHRIKGSETDCLNLNVFTRALPKNTSDSLKPVMFWIHGGAFYFGSNSTDAYGAEYLMTEDIVLVTINYRLGVLGFLCLQDSSLGVPGNNGMKDMVLALRWVQRNIKYFGGNPKNVTIFGESAGAASVHYLCLSPLSKGLFHKAIAQSGSAISGWAKGNKTNGLLIAELLGYKEKNEEKILTHLKSLSVEQLLTAQHKTKINFGYADFPFGPVVEKPSNEQAFMLEEPIDIVKNGTFTKIPLMMGYNSEEALLYQLLLTVNPKARAHKDLEMEIPSELNFIKGTDKSKKLAEKMISFYFNGEEISEKNIRNIFPLKTDAGFHIGIHRSIIFHARASTAPVYYYKMSVDTSLNFAKKFATPKGPCCVCCNMCCICYTNLCCCNVTRNLCLKCRDCLPRLQIQGAAHIDDIGYLFKSKLTALPKRNSIEEISVKRFVKLWTNFARTGNPTPFKTDLIDVLWKPVTPGKVFYLDIGRELQLGTNPDKERMEFWESVFGD